MDMMRLCVRAGLCIIYMSLATAARAQTRAETAAAGGADPFIIRPGDVLRIWVWPDTTLGGRFSVEESGLVYLPVIGEVHAAGMSLEALRLRLRQGYLEAIKTPVVSVTPLFRVSVLGAVERPGLYQIDPTQSLFDVISLAGGLRPDAKANALRVIRNGQVLEINAERALETGEALLALSLRSGDRIVVPRRRSFLTAQNIFYVLQSAVIVVSIIQLAQR